MSTTHAGRENPTDATELPANWAETQTTVIARFERDDGAVVRVRTDFAVRSAAECNNATHTDATGTVEVVFNAEPLPSDAETIYEGGTEADARKAALGEVEVSIEFVGG